MIERCSYCHELIVDSNQIEEHNRAYHPNCKIRFDYMNHPIIIALRTIQAKTKYLLQCDPRDITASQHAQTILNFSKSEAMNFKTDEET
jgi:hypothetical protein